MESARELFQRMAKVEQEVARVDEAQGGHEVLCAQRYEMIITEQKKQQSMLDKIYTRIWAVVVTIIGSLLVIAGGLVVYIFTNQVGV